jgi:ATP-dependent Zn protease
MNLGKSPARFDERPDGVSFDDIAGIDEAKLNSKKLFHF